MPYVAGVPASNARAANPAYYQDYDNLGFSFNVKHLLQPKKLIGNISKTVGKTTATVIKPLSPVLKPVAAVAGGIVRTVVPGGGFIVGAASGLKNLVTGRKANAVQRVASSTAKVATDLVTATPLGPSSRSDGWNGVDYTGGPMRTPMATVAARPSILTQFQRFKADPGGTILRAGARINKQAEGLGAKIATTGDKAAAIAAAADSAAAAGDALGSRRLRDAAARLAQLARAGQDTAANVSGVIQQAGAAAEGAAAGAVTGAAAEGAGQGFSKFLESTPGKVAAAGVVAGGVYLFTRGGGGGGRRRAGGNSFTWE